MIVAVVADNLGGGSARVGEAIINGLVSDERINQVIVFSNSRISLKENLKLKIIHSYDLLGFTKIKKRTHFVKQLPRMALVLNLTNFPIGVRGLEGRREFVLLHNAYFFALPDEVSILRSPLFVFRNAIARALILKWRLFFTSSEFTSFLVQSDWMYKIVRKSIPQDFKIKVIRPHRLLVKITNELNDFKFPHELNCAIDNDICWFYPATGEKHKNHFLLLELLKRSIDINPNVKVILTLPIDNSDTHLIMKRAVKLGVENNLINIGWIKDDVKNYLMKYSTGVIFLSRFESLGLPLLEIRDLSCPSLVLKSEISEYVLGDKHEFYNLFSAQSTLMQEQREKFSRDLANGHAQFNTYNNQENVSVQQAYFFDMVEGSK